MTKITDVKVLAKAIKRLERDDGKLLPEDVLNAARDPKSPLHDHFTWDETEAAHKHNLHEARQLIRAVRIDVVINDVPIKVCGYVRDPECQANEPGYRNINTVRREEDLARATLVDEMQRVISAVNRAKKLALLLGVKEDVENIETLARTITTCVSQEQEESRA